MKSLAEYFVTISANTAPVARSLDALKGKLLGFTGSFSRTMIGQSSLGWLFGVGAAGAAASAFIYKSVQAARDYEGILKRIEFLYQQTGGSVGRTVTQMKQFSGEMEKLTGIDDDDILRAQQRLLQFRQVQGQVFDDTIRAAADIARVRNQSIEDVVFMLGRAVESPKRGMMMLRRLGITLTPEEQAGITRATKAGDEKAAQRALLDAINKTYGGAAEALKTPFMELDASIHALKVALGTELLPAVSAVAKMMADWVEESGGKIPGATPGEAAAKRIDVAKWLMAAAVHGAGEKTWNPIAGITNALKLAAAMAKGEYPEPYPGYFEKESTQDIVLRKKAERERREYQAQFGPVAAWGAAHWRLGEMTPEQAAFLQEIKAKPTGKALPSGLPEYVAKTLTEAQQKRAIALGIPETIVYQSLGMGTEARSFLESLADQAEKTGDELDDLRKKAEEFFGKYPNAMRDAMKLVDQIERRGFEKQVKELEKTIDPLGKLKATYEDLYKIRAKDPKLLGEETYITALAKAIEEVATEYGGLPDVIDKAYQAMGYVGKEAPLPAAIQRKREELRLRREGAEAWKAAPATGRLNPAIAYAQEMEELERQRRAGANPAAVMWGMIDATEKFRKAGWDVMGREPTMPILPEGEGRTAQQFFKEMAGKIGWKAAPMFKPGAGFVGLEEFSKSFQRGVLEQGIQENINRGMKALFEMNANGVIIKKLPEGRGFDVFENK